MKAQPIKTVALTIALAGGLALSNACAAEMRPGLKADKELAAKLAQCAATYTENARWLRTIKQNADKLLEQGQWHYDGAVALSDDAFVKAQFILRTKELISLFADAKRPKEEQVAALNMFLETTDRYKSGCEQLRSAHETMLVTPG
jgi:hypothetical protein